MRDQFRIIKFSAENIKRIGVIQFEPKGNVIKLSGKNGSGKTSVLDCIEYALCGTENVPSRVIRKGHRSATIQLDLGEVVVTRKFLDSGRTTLQIMSKADRSLYQSPQSLLDGLMARVSFDPLEFIRMKPKDQFASLRQIVNIDLEAFDAAYQRDYELRREVKKEYLAIEIRRDSIPVQADLPLERRDEEALTAEMAEASQYNEAIERERIEREEQARMRDGCAGQVEALGNKVEALEAQLLAAKKSLVVARTNYAKMEKMMDGWEPLPEPKNVRDLADQLNAARIVNAAMVKKEQRDALQAEIDALKERHKALGVSLERTQAERASAISETHFPVEGLGFGDDEVLWQGLPFNQVSNADQIRASVAIGMAMNPRIRVMRVKDGSLLDSDSMAIVEQFAREEEFQIWVEVVDESGKVGIYLEDGEIKAVNDENEVPEKPERDMRIDLPMPGGKTVEELDPPPPPAKRRPARKARA